MLYKHDKLVPLPNIKAKAVSCGKTQSVLIDLNDNLLILENGNITKINIKVKEVSCSRQIVAIDLNNNVWVTGDNMFGQLGISNDKDNYLDILTMVPIKAKKVYASSKRTFIIDIDDNLIYAGLYIYTSDQSPYNKVSTFTTIPQIKVLDVAGNGSTLAIILLMTVD
jgi:hypothetical protein